MRHRCDPPGIGWVSLMLSDPELAGNRTGERRNDKGQRTKTHVHPSSFGLCPSSFVFRLPLVASIENGDNSRKSNHPGVATCLLSRLASTCFSSKTTWRRATRSCSFSNRKATASAAPPTALKRCDDFAV